MGPFDELVRTLRKRKREHVPSLPGSFTAIKAKRGVACFVDGGSGVLHSTPDYAVALLRFYACTYAGSARQACAREEGYCYIKKNGERFTVCFFGLPFVPMELDIEDVIPEQVVDPVRKVCELLFAKEVLKTMTEDSVLVLDGDLDAEHDAERTAFADLRAQARKTKVHLAALAKTNRFVVGGVSLIRALHKQGREGVWLYEDGEVCFARLHERSHYLFRLDTAEPKTVAEILAYSSSDPVFLGYPYGLVEADARARVSKKEVMHLQLLLETRVSAHDELSALNAHGVLDRLHG